MFTKTSSPDCQIVVGCSRSEATRPTLASQVSPKNWVFMEMMLLHTVRLSLAYHLLLPSSIRVLDGEDGGFKYPIKSIKYVYQLVRLLGVFWSVLMTLWFLELVILDQNRSFYELRKCVV